MGICYCCTLPYLRINTYTDKMKFFIAIVCLAFVSTTFACDPEKYDANVAEFQRECDPADQCKNYNECKKAVLDARAAEDDCEGEKPTIPGLSAYSDLDEIEERCERINKEKKSKAAMLGCSVAAVGIVLLI